MFQLLLIPIAILIGVLLSRFDPRIKEHGPYLLNRLILWVFMPATVLSLIPNLPKDRPVTEWLIPAFMPWLIFVLSWLVVKAISPFMKWDRKTVGLVILIAGLGNTSFVGFPLLEALLGPESLKTGVLVDQLGTFMVASTLGVIVASQHSSGQLTVMQVLKNLIQFPPFIFLSIALILLPFGPYPDWTPIFQKLGAPLIPSSVMTLGMLLDWDPKILKRHVSEISVGLGLRLIIWPLLVLFAIRWGYSDVPMDLFQKTIILEAGMAPMFSILILSERFTLHSKIASSLILFGIVLSLVTVPVWSWVLSFF